MTTPHTGLTPLYLTALHSHHSFIKSINPGTGLGKTYSAFEAINEYITAQKEQTPHIFIYTAPQHNQIIIDEKTADKLAANQCEVITVLPVSDMALSNIDSVMNAYQIAKELFLTPRGSQNALFKSLAVITKKLDAQHQRRENEIPFNKRLHTILQKIASIEAEQNRQPSKTHILPSLSQTTYSEDEDEELRQMMVDALHEENRQEEAERSALKIKAALEKISQHLTKLCEYSYSNEFFYHALTYDQALKEPSRKKWRAATASFYPFLHLQKTGRRYSLLTMTVAKMMTRHKVFLPTSKKGVLTWRRKDVSLHDLVTDTSLLVSQASQVLKETPKQVLKAQNIHSHFFDSNFILFIDESDAAKGVITENLSHELKDNGVIQAIGAFAKEVGDVVANENHISIANHIQNSSAPNLLEAIHELHNNDAVSRILAKESIWSIRKKIYEVLIQKNWIFARDDKSTKSIFKKTNLLFTGSLTAPYCTVTQTIDAEVFQTTSAFGGEMYGFTGSSKINNLSLVNMGNSFSIMTKEAASRLASHHQHVPLAYFFLLLTEIFLYFRLISKDRGSTEMDVKHASEINAFLVSDNVRGFLTYIHNFHRQSTGALSGIGAPFRTYEKSKTTSANKLHTVAAQSTLTKIKTMITQEHFQRAFSDNKELIHLVDDNIHTFSAPQPSPINLHFANVKGHTIYGMAQVHDQRYPIASHQQHVAFPLIFRAKSAEQFIVDLVNTKTRKNGVFLMSATGGFKANHISAFSLETLELLLKEQKSKAQFLTMDAEEYACVVAMQQARKQQKKLNVAFFDQEFIKPSGGHLWEQSWEGRAEIATNKYKKNEFLTVHAALKHVSQQEQPYFALALAQTHRHVTRHLHHLSKKSPYVVTTQADPALQSVECLFSSHSTPGEESTNTTEASYAIFLVHAKQGPSTLVVCYAAALDKALKRVFLNQDSNPYQAENRLKRALGLAEAKAAPLADNPNTNPMDYLLNEHHGHQVLIISAYQSAARGINLIVNNSPLTARLSKAKDKPYQKRDLDALFICAVPYYSELKTTSSADSLHSDVAQQQFFHRCRLYFYRIEELARRSYQKESIEYSSEDIDLFIAHNDFIRAYFLDQHHLALMSSLMQGVGRIERTGAAQEQYLYITKEVKDIVQNGMQAARKGLTRFEKSQLSKGLSMVNTALFDGLLELKSESAKDPDNTITAFEQTYFTQAVHFEEIKTRMLDHCQQLRNEQEQTVSLSLQPFIHFYERFRSGSLWTLGRTSYLEQLHQAISLLPVSVQPTYQQFVDQLFISANTPWPSYQTRTKTLNGQSRRSTKILSDHAEATIEDLDAAYLLKRQAKVNPYYDYDITTKKYVYAAPWFLADMAGNYGEMVLKKALRTLVSNQQLTHLQYSQHLAVRHCYEKADFFVQYKNQVLAIDTKHYHHLNAFVSSNLDDGREPFSVKAEKALRHIQAVFNTDSTLLPTRLVLINVYSIKQTTAGSKTVIDSEGQMLQNLYTLAVGDDPHTISEKILKLLCAR